MTLIQFFGNYWRLTININLHNNVKLLLYYTDWNIETLFDVGLYFRMNKEKKKLFIVMKLQ